MRKFLILCGILLISVPLFAQEGEGKIGKRFGIGMHAGYPVLYGISGKFYIAPKIGIQAIGSYFSIGDYSTTLIEGRGIYRFTADKKVNPYAGVGIGSWISKGEELDWETWEYKEVTEITPTFEFFGGIEYSWPWLPELISDIEIGFFMVNFKEVDLSLTGIGFGAGVHYFF